VKREKLLILFAKWPGEKNSKSRIARFIGEESTKKFCFACLNDLISKIKMINDIDFVIIPNTLRESCLFTNKYGTNSLSLEQLNISLSNSTSEIFHNLFSFFLEKYEKVSLIPMDVPHINIGIIEESFVQLDKCDQVFGPEENGGVYLMGLNKLIKPIFSGVRWSTKYSFRDLISNCESPSILEIAFDLNELSDLLKLNSEMLNSCPCLVKFIKSRMLNINMIEEEIILA